MCNMIQYLYILINTHQVALVEIYHHTESDIFLLIKKAFKIYPLSSFQIGNAILLSPVTVLYATSW